MTSTLRKAHTEIGEVKALLRKFPVPVLSGNVRKPKKLGKVTLHNQPKAIH